MKAMIIVTDGLEECEALLTYDLLYRAGIEVDLVGPKPEIDSAHQLVFKTHRLLDEIDPLAYDCLILPGGMPGTKNLEDDERVQELIDLFVKEGRCIAAICAAPSILIHKGLLKDGRFVCFPGFEGDMTPSAEKAVKEGRFITAKGLGAAFEFARLIISTLVNEETAKDVLDRTQYY